MKIRKLCRGMISTVLISVMLLSLGAGSVFAAGGQNNSQQEDVKASYDLTATASGKMKFYNKLDGYSIEIPQGMTVTNILPGVQTVLETQDVKLEIYKENQTTKAGMQTLLVYGNKFKENKVDHFVDYESTFHAAGYEGYVFQYHRNPLAKVVNDKNYYTEVTLLVPGKAVYTFRFKSTYILDYGKVYLDIVNSFRSEAVTASAFPFQFAERTTARGWNQATQTAFNTYYSDSSPLTWGIFEPAAPVWFNELNALESHLQYKFPVLLHYNNILEDQSTSQIRYALTRGKENGRIVELTIQTKEQASGSNMVYSVLNGQYDQYLKNLAADIRAADTPVLFRLANEMNGDWCVYSAYHLAKDADVYVEFYKYVYRFMETEGVNDKLIWVWNPNEKSFPNFKWNHELLYYPGSEYVDVVGITGYNTGTYYNGESWRDFDTIYSGIYNNALAWYNKPLMITEFACSSHGGDKVAWMDNMFQSIKNYPKIKVAIWWSGADYDVDMTPARTYWLDETEETRNAFKRNINK